LTLQILDANNGNADLSTQTGVTQLKRKRPGNCLG
jgi:hypothetical protein